MNAASMDMAAILSMLSAARDNKVDEIRKLANKGIPVGICNQMGQTALHIAALWGNVEAVAVLIELGMSPNIKNARGSTPLHFAASAKSNVVATCKALIERGASTESLDMMGRAPYELAESDEVRSLLGGPDPRIFEFSDEGKAAELQQLLDSSSGPGGPPVSVRVLDSAGRTPLNLAVAAESIDTIKVILKKDPDVLDLPDGSGDTALHVAAGIGNLDVMNYLLSLKPNSINTQNLDQSEYSSGSWLLDGEVVEPLDKTPLAIAVAAGDCELAEALLKHGAKVDLMDYDKRTPLQSALEVGDAEMATLLLQHGADPNTPSQDFVSGLHILAQRGSLDVLKLMLSKGADVSKTNDEGWAPLHLAARSGKADKAQALLEAGAAVNAVNSLGNTALHLASVNGHAAVVQLLLQHSADQAAQNKDGKTAKDVAKNDEVKQLLA